MATLTYPSKQSKGILLFNEKPFCTALLIVERISEN